MEVLNVKDSVDGVKSVMDDGVHLNAGAMGVMMDQVITKTEENLAARKKGPTEKAGQAVKKTRVASSGSFKGAGWGGRGGQGGLGGPAAKRTYSAY